MKVPSIYLLKPGFQRFLRPLLPFLHRSGVTPNDLTLAGVLLSAWLGVLVLFYQQVSLAILWVPVGLLLRMVINALDGMLARRFGLQSKHGVLPLTTLPHLSDAWVIAFAFLTVFNEFVGVAAQGIGSARRYDGPMGKSDRAVLIASLCISSYFLPTWTWGNLTLIVGCFLLLISTGIRWRNALRQSLAK